MTHLEGSQTGYTWVVVATLLTMTATGHLFLIALPFAVISLLPRRRRRLTQSQVERPTEHT